MIKIIPSQSPLAFEVFTNQKIALQGYCSREMLTNIYEVFNREGDGSIGIEEIHPETVKITSPFPFRLFFIGFTTSIISPRWAEVKLALRVEVEN